MYPIPPTETLVQTKTCRHCSALFPITDKDLEFYEKISPVFPLQPSPPTPLPEGEGRKVEWDKIRYLIPTPTLCPDCRQQRRLSFRNDRKLYKRKCDATDKNIVSLYSPDKPFTVYHQDYWWSDKWDPMDYWRDFDFNRGFFEQFGELMKEVPVSNIVNVKCEGCDYSSFCHFSKDCYLSSFSLKSQNILYGYQNILASNCVDCLGSKSEIGYELVDCIRCYSAFFCTRCEDSRFMKYCIWCVNCEYCIWCVNLQGRKYSVYNQPVSEMEFHRIWEEVRAEEIVESRKPFLLKSPFPPDRSMLSEDNHHCFDMNESIRCVSCYDGSYFENCHYCNTGGKCTDSYDVYRPVPCLDYSLEGVYTSGHWVMFSIDANGKNEKIILSQNVTSCTNLFGCIGLRNKSYCILNKQYTKEEYEALVPKIIEHTQKTWEWGEFFPSSLSPFGYNETVAQEYYPLTREEVLSPLSSEGEGSGVRFNWSDYEPPFPRVEKIIPADKLPDDISKIPDDILNWAIECEVTKKPFRIIKQELEFYRKHHLPIPRRHPDQRHLDRMALRNPRKLFERKCDKCGVEMVTTYSPERKEIVYCEKCYEKEVIG